MAQRRLSGAERTTTRRGSGPMCRHRPRVPRTCPRTTVGSVQAREWCGSSSRAAGGGEGHARCWGGGGGVTEPKRCGPVGGLSRKGQPPTRGGGAGDAPGPGKGMPHAFKKNTEATRVYSRRVRGMLQGRLVVPPGSRSGLRLVAQVQSGRSFATAPHRWQQTPVPRTILDYTAPCHSMTQRR